MDLAAAKRSKQALGQWAHRERGHKEAQVVQDNQLEEVGGSGDQPELPP